jgi:signal transduction histidine kinase
LPGSDPAVDKRDDPHAVDGVVAQLQGVIDDLRRSRRNVLRAADADRRLIERSLHDGLQQQLVALAVQLRRARDLVDDDPAGAKASLAESAEIVRESIASAANLAQQIYPPWLVDGRGLAIALRSAADRAEAGATISVSLASSQSAELIAQVYWCCLEALSMVLPGAQVTIGVTTDEDAIRFAVSGRGGYSTVASERLRDRVEALGNPLVVTIDGDEWRISGVIASDVT